MPDTPTPDVSVVIPVKDEAESVPQLAREVVAAFDGGPWVWECVWVDDGSGDATLEQLRSLNLADPRHRFVAHDRNYGQSAALLTGFSEVERAHSGHARRRPSERPRRPAPADPHPRVPGRAHGQRRQGEAAGRLVAQGVLDG